MYIQVPARVALTKRRNLYFEFPAPGSPMRYSPEQPEVDFPHSKPVAADLLDEFRLLRDAPDDRIVYFAKTWGVLRINRRGRFRSEVRQGTEPLAIWRQLAGRVDAILRIAADLRKGEPGRPEDWAVLRSQLGSFGLLNPRVLGSLQEHPQWDPKGVRQAQIGLKDELNSWLALWGPRLRTFIHPGGAGVEFDGAGQLLSALTVQVVSAALNGRVFVCDGCREPYLRKGRSPKRKESNFCARCGRAEALRQANRRRLERERRSK